MIIDVRKLNATKQYTGEMEFSYSAPETLIDIPYVQFASPVQIRFSYELYEDNAIQLNGTVSYQLEGKCSRCLKAAKASIVGELDALFEPKKDGEDYSYSNGIVDLKKAVDEAIMASMPFLLSCGDDCVSLSYSDETAND